MGSESISVCLTELWLGSGEVVPVVLCVSVWLGKGRPNEPWERELLLGGEVLLNTMVS